MGKFIKLVNKILQANSDRNIAFEDLRKVLLRLGFSERIKGSHHIFTRHDLEEILNLQPTSENKAKAYQVKQVRELLTNYKLITQENGDDDSE